MPYLYEALKEYFSEGRIVLFVRNPKRLLEILLLNYNLQMCCALLVYNFLLTHISQPNFLSFEKKQLQEISILCVCVCVCVCARAHIRAYMQPTFKFRSNRFIFVVLSMSALSLNAIPRSQFNFHKFRNNTVADA